jgi:hypothetical protein
MHPLIHHELVNPRVADFRRRAGRDQIARAPPPRPAAPVRNAARTRGLAARPEFSPATCWPSSAPAARDQ